MIYHLRATLFLTEVFSILSRSALKPLNTAKADVFTGVLNGWDCIGEVLFDGRFPLKKKIYIYL